MRTQLIIVDVKQEVERLLLMYNDEWPNGTSSQTAAHAKGVVAFDGRSGFWLVHSVPRFPPAPGVNYSFPITGLRYGQTMLCFSLPFNQADLIGKGVDTSSACGFDFDLLGVSNVVLSLVVSLFTL